jgi:hypothetical protein
VKKQQLWDAKNGLVHDLLHQTGSFVQADAHQDIPTGFQRPA